MTKNDTRFIAYQFKLAAKRQKELNAQKKLVKNAKPAKKRNYGCHSELPTDTKWDDVFVDMHAGHRFYDDKQFKGHNGTFEYAICEL